MVFKVAAISPRLADSNLVLTISATILLLPLLGLLTLYIYYTPSTLKVFGTRLYEA